MHPDDTAPLPASRARESVIVGDAGAPPSPEEVLEVLRGFCSDGINGVVTRALGEILLPDDQAKLCLDVAQFTTFLMAVKIVECRRQPLTRENVMAAYWPMQKALKDEVPGMLRKFVDQAAAHG